MLAPQLWQVVDGEMRSKLPLTSGASFIPGGLHLECASFTTVHGQPWFASFSQRAEYKFKYLLKFKTG